MALCVVSDILEDILSQCETTLEYHRIDRIALGVAVKDIMEDIVGRLARLGPMLDPGDDPLSDSHICPPVMPPDSWSKHTMKVYPGDMSLVIDANSDVISKQRVPTPTNGARTRTSILPSVSPLDTVRYTPVITKLESNRHVKSELEKRLLAQVLVMEATPPPPSRPTVTAPPPATTSVQPRTLSQDFSFDANGNLVLVENNRLSVNTQPAFVPAAVRVRSQATEPLSAKKSIRRTSSTLISPKVESAVPEFVQAKSSTGASVASLMKLREGVAVMEMGKTLRGPEVDRHGRMSRQEYLDSIRSSS